MDLGDLGSSMAFLEHDDDGNPLGDKEEKQVDTDFFNGARAEGDSPSLSR